MKRISDYTIYCTKEQIKKALELSIPIETCGYYYKQQIGCNTISDIDLHIIPTAEQIIGYLETLREISEFDIAKWDEKSWAYKVHLKDKPALIGKDLFSSRPEATLAAIDAALDYLINNKK